MNYLIVASITCVGFGFIALLGWSLCVISARTTGQMEEEARR